jgi:hypothetical protein
MTLYLVRTEPANMVEGWHNIQQKGDQVDVLAR